MPEDLAFDAFRADSTEGNGEAFELTQRPTGGLRVFVDGELSEEWTVDRDAGVLEVADPPTGAQVAVVYRADRTGLTRLPPDVGPLPRPTEIDWSAEAVDPAAYYSYRTAREAKSANARDDLMVGLASVIVLLWAVAEIADEFL